MYSTVKKYFLEISNTLIGNRLMIIGKENWQVYRTVLHDTLSCCLNCHVYFLIDNSIAQCRNDIRVTFVTFF